MSRTGSPESYVEVIRAFSKVADTAAVQGDIEHVLQVTAAEVRRLFGIGRCSIYLRETLGGLFRGYVAGTGSPDDDEEVRRLTCGTDSDGFTRELLETRAPVLIADARRDTRPVRATVRRWDIRAMLGVPMIAHGEVVGLMFLDDAGVRHVFRDEDPDLALAFAGLAASAIDQANAVAAARAEAEAATKQARLLQRSHVLEERACALTVAAGSIEDVAEGLASVIKRTVFIYDPALRIRAVAGADNAPVRSIFDPAVRRSLVEATRGAIDGVKPVVVGPFPDDGLHHRYLIAPIKRRAREGGYIVIPEVTRALTAIDVGVSRRVAGLLGLALSARRRGGAVERQARRTLVRDLLHTREAVPDLAERAAQHGLELERRHAIVLFRLRCGAELDGDHVADALNRAGLPGKHLIECDGRGNVAAILPHDRVSARAGAGLRHHVERAVELLGGDVVAALSSGCELERAAARAYDEACRVLDTLLAVGAEGHGGVLASEELGVGRLVLAALDHADAERFAEQTLGPLLDPGGDGGRSLELLRTLQVYFDSCQNVRRAAAQLAVHENTIRYRLARIGDLTGLDLAGNPDDQLSAQLAVRILDLNGRTVPTEPAGTAEGEPRLALVASA